MGIDLAQQSTFDIFGAVWTCHARIVKLSALT